MESKLAQLLIDGRVSGTTGDLLDIKPMAPIPVKPLLSKILAEMNLRKAGNPSGTLFDHVHMFERLQSGQPELGRTRPDS